MSIFGNAINKMQRHRAVVTNTGQLGRTGETAPTMTGREIINSYYNDAQLSFKNRGEDNPSSEQVAALAWELAKKDGNDLKQYLNQRDVVFDRMTGKPVEQAPIEAPMVQREQAPTVNWSEVPRRDIQRGRFF